MGSSGAVDVAAMADSDDLDHEAGVDDFIEDPVGTDAHPVHAVLSHKRDTAWGSGIVGEEVYCRRP